MNKVKDLLVSYLNLSETHNFSRWIVPLKDKTCQEIASLLRSDDKEEKIYKEIENILSWDNLKELRNFLFRIAKHWALEQSENIWNNFEEEKEIKILDVDYLDLIERLEFMKAKEVFDWIIDDVYLDLPWNKLENNNLLENNFKASFRIRYKLSKEMHFSIYYTIKRKKPKIKNLKIPTRICYEKEFEIKSPWMVIDELELINLKAYRRKTKQRIAYVLNWVKFDIDLYEQINGYPKIPPLLEIETDNPDLLPWLLLSLGLNKKVISDSWSRWMFEKFYQIPRTAHLIQDSEMWLIVPEKAFEYHRLREDAKNEMLKN